MIPTRADFAPMLIVAALFAILTASVLLWLSEPYQGQPAAYYISEAK